MKIIGHAKERATLRQSALHGTAAQSYVFAGPRGVGKSLCALEFAANLVEEPHFEPREDKPYPFDVMVIRPAIEVKRGITKTKSIPTETIREGLGFLSHFPSVGKFRVLIIEDAHRLSETAQNALLKTLEEPASTAVIILVTHEPGSLLSTVLSRVKRVPFHFVPEESMREALQEEFNGEKLSQVASFFFALGRPGLVLEALRNPETFTVEKELLGKLFRLSTLSLSERLTLAERLGLHTEQCIRLLEWWLPGLYQQAWKTKEKKSTRQFFSLLEEIEQVIKTLKTTQSNVRLVLEKLFLSV